MTRPARMAGAPPARMRNYRVEAELRETPDLHQLAQLFIGIALRRAEHERLTQDAPSTTAPSPVDTGEVESHL